jgi:hypothetical protein
VCMAGHMLFLISHASKLNSAVLLLLLLLPAFAGPSSCGVALPLRGAQPAAGHQHWQ